MKQADKCKTTSIIEEIAKEFLVYVWSDTRPSPELLRARHEQIMQLAEKAGPFEAWDVVWLFYRLEQVANYEISKATALAQTTKPDALLPYGLPEKLVENTKTSANFRTAERARENHPDNIAANEFKEWAKLLPEELRKPANAEAVRAIPGFLPRWDKKDETLNRWWREVYPDHKFKHGRPPKKRK